MHGHRGRSLAPILLLASALPGLAAGPAGLDLDQLARLRLVQEVRLAPDGRSIAYALSVPRRPGNDDDGPAWSELHLVAFEGGSHRPFVTGKVNVSKLQFTPDGRSVTYLAKRGDDKEAALWAIPVEGGESRRLVGFETAIEEYALSPDGKSVAFVARRPESEPRKKAKERGYSEEVFEERILPQELRVVALPAGAATAAKPRLIEIPGSVLALDWGGDGARLAVAVAPSHQIDQRLMQTKVWIVDPTTGERRAVLDNPGKLGEFALSPDGRHVALISAADLHDPKEGRLLLAATDGGALRDLLPELEGHVIALAWRDATTLAFIADERAESWLGEVQLDGGGLKRLAASAPGPLLTKLAVSADGRRLALIGETPGHPAEAFAMTRVDAAPRRLTDSNPWLAGVALARQEVLRFPARDGLELDGILISPLNPGTQPAPLLLMVHGGPEAHDRNGWVTNYSRPGQVAAARGFLVLYPNYRGSTGRGVAFSKLGQGDGAGKEFDDLVDAVDVLVARGRADRDRVGITGGSYGGYATAWCATRYTERFRAGVMFVGISNALDKPLTTEIPREDALVHLLADPWDEWQSNLERSPIYHAAGSRTALLIAGGTADTRVDPSQSLQLYRLLKQAGRAPVRYVRYPGEQHGNRRAAARDDYARRLLEWMEHFVMDRKDDLPPPEREVEESQP
ncbi:MAG TPA: S9 family peptidase [Candidatus Polarisedimenticolaceae bacterium]|nr:S9 family peptidase [Candidatus Polarisedimenticolaceae bacterium]